MSSHDKFTNHNYHKNLKIYKNWNQDIAQNIANNELIIMTAEHWKVIYLIRTFYLKFNITPSMRMLIIYMKKNMGQEKGNSRYLFKLFSHNPINLASKIAGVPKPTTCL